jgi:hypothetical protein
MSLLHAHRVFVTKCRRSVFTATMLAFCEHTLRYVPRQPGWANTGLKSQPYAQENPGHRRSSKPHASSPRYKASAW